MLGAGAPDGKAPPRCGRRADRPRASTQLLLCGRCAGREGQHGTVQQTRRQTSPGVDQAPDVYVVVAEINKWWASSSLPTRRWSTTPNPASVSTASTSATERRLKPCEVTGMRLMAAGSPSPTIN